MCPDSRYATRRKAAEKVRSNLPMPCTGSLGVHSPMTGARRPGHRNDFLSAFDTLFSCQGALIRSSCGTGTPAPPIAHPSPGREDEPATWTRGRDEAASRITIAGSSGLAIRVTDGATEIAREEDPVWPKRCHQMLAFRYGYHENYLYPGQSAR